MKIIITSEKAGKTIKELLLRDMAFSGGLLKSLKARENGITVNGEHKTVRYTLCEGDVLILADEDREEDTSPYITPSDIPIGIAYEDDHVTVADKPYAMPAHPSYSHRDDTVANALAHRYSSAPYVFRPVNRLDGDFIGALGCFTISLGNSGFKLLQVGLQNRLVSPVSGVEHLGNLNTLGSRLDIRHK